VAPGYQHSTRDARLSMRGHFDSWGSCICPRKDLLSPGQTGESHLEVEKDEEQSSGRVGEETSSNAVNRDTSPMRGSFVKMS
jgi:hypothetical protein